MKGLGLVLLGGAAGALVWSLLTVLLTAIYARHAFADGQYGMVFMMTVPFGAIGGALAGEAAIPGSSGLMLAAACLFLGPTILMLLMMATGPGGSASKAIASLTAPWIISGIAVGVALLYWAWALRAR